jgi:hypothetical protein
MLLWWLPLFFFFFSLVPVAGFGCPSLSLDYMRTHMHKHPTWVSLSFSCSSPLFSVCLSVSLSMCVTMLNALTQWSESTRLGFITPSSWCTRGGGAARLSLSVFVGFCTVREKMDSNEVVVVVVPVFFGSVQMEAMPSCWESEQKHPRGGDEGGVHPIWEGGQWERRVKEATKNRRGRDVTVEGGVIPKKLVRVFVMENPFCDEWQHSHPLAQQDRPIPDSRFSPASSSRSALIWELPHPSEEDDMRSHILCLDRGYTVHLFRRLPSAYLTAREK